VAYTKRMEAITKAARGAVTVWDGVSKGLLEGRNGLAREFMLNFRVMIGLGSLLSGIDPGCGWSGGGDIIGDRTSR
jgi:hypothetical protein